MAGSLLYIGCEITPTSIDAKNKLISVVGIPHLI